MSIHVNYNNSTLGRRMIAVASCTLGGAIILVLGICGASGEYETLPKYGFDAVTIPFYALVVACGVLTLCRFKFALLGAIGAMLLEFVAYVTTQMSTTPDVSILVLLKFAVLAGALQLAVQIVSFDETDDPPPSRPASSAQARLPHGSNRPMPRPPVGRNQPPRPRR